MSSLTTMGVDKSQRVTLGAPPDGVELTPEEYFVLSRVQGTPTVGEILATSGLAAADASRILDKLIAAGVVVKTDVVPTVARQPKRRALPGEDLRRKAAQRRKRLLAAQFGAKPNPAARVAAVINPAASTDDDDDDDDDDHDDVVDFERVETPLVGLSDDRLDPAVEIEVEEQRKILGLADSIEDLSQFEFLGLAPTHDMQAIKRAFHETSRQLHPDTYYGRDLGSFRELLAELFRRAKASYAELRDPEVRTPWVDHHIAEVAHRKKTEEEAAERERAASEMQRQADEADAKVRREQRTVERARRQRERLKERMLAQADRYRADAEIAEDNSNHARAANLFRLAMRADPHNAHYKAKWEENRVIARTARAADAFANAQSLQEMGKSEEARLLFVDAAEADPTAEHLAFAADAIRVHDRPRARDLALAALDALGASEAQAEADKKTRRRKPVLLGKLHLMIGRAFLAAGQKQTAKQQGTFAQGYLPDDMEVRALLKACKAK